MAEQFDESFADVMRLATAVQDWTARTFPAPPAGHTCGDCQWCPICQFMAVLRGERPEVTERVAEAGTALASAFRAFVDAAAPKANDAGEHPHQAPRPRVQRIDLGAAAGEAD